MTFRFVWLWQHKSRSITCCMLYFSWRRYTHYCNSHCSRSSAPATRRHGNKCVYPDSFRDLGTVPVTHGRTPFLKATNLALPQKYKQWLPNQPLPDLHLLWLKRQIHTVDDSKVWIICSIVETFAKKCLYNVALFFMNTVYLQDRQLYVAWKDKKNRIQKYIAERTCCNSAIEKNLVDFHKFTAFFVVYMQIDWI